MKETIMSKGSPIADTSERLTEIGGRCDRAAARHAQLALWTIEELIAELIKRKELKNNIIKALEETIADFTALHYQLTAEVAELAAVIAHAALQVSRPGSEAADPLPSVMDVDESTSDGRGAP
jgi:hypothetical protein